MASQSRRRRTTRGATDRVRLALAAAAIALAASLPPMSASASRLDNPVWVDDSPQAWEMLQQARAHREANAEESIRLYQTLLDDYAFRLVPADAAIDNRLIAVRRAVLDDLLADRELLAMYQRAESAEAARRKAAGDARRVAITRPLTEAGLEAMIELGQASLELGRFRRSRSWLERVLDHPEAGPEARAAAWRMLGTASAYQGDAKGVAHAAQALQALGEAGEEPLAALEQLQGYRAPDGPPRGVTPLDRTDAEGLGEIVSQTIWSALLDSSLYARRFGDSMKFMVGDEHERGGDRDGRYATAAPTIAANVVYVNEGHRVRAVDRFTGRNVWERPHIDRPGLRVIDRDNEVPQDLNLIAVAEGLAVTTTGHGYATDRSSEGRLIALDAETGELRWATTFDRLGNDDQYEGLYPYGRPIIEDGEVYVLARSSSRQLVTSTYVVAVDLMDGGLRWIRHIASSGEQVRSGRPMSSLIWRDGALYVSTPVGAVAAVDATTSETRWLHRETAPISTRGAVRRPWELSTPAVTERSVIALTPDQRRIIELDREAGAVVRSTEATSRSRWNGPAYLLTNDRMVYGVGSEIRAFSVDDLDNLLWMLPVADEASLQPGEPLIAADFEVAGRVQVVGDRLVAPTDRGTLVIDAETGRILRVLETRGAGNPVAAGGEIVVATSATLDAYMSLPRAEALLRQRIAAQPENAEPALSLVQLAMRVEDFGLALEAAELAQEALEQRMERDHQQELFASLVELHRRGLAADQARALALYDLMSRAAQTADQQLEHRLARADWLSERSPVDAAIAYRSILDAPALAPVLRREGDMVRPASTWVAMRLRDLADERGEAVQAALDQAAAEALERAESAGGEADVPPRRLADLAARHPLSSLAAEMRVRAARAWAEQGETRAALASVLEGINTILDPPDEGRLLGAAIDVASRAGWGDAADRILAYAIIERPGAVLVDLDGEARTATAWRATLRSESGQTFEHAAAAVGPLAESEATLIDGSLLPSHEDFRGRRPHGMTDAALLRSEGEVRLASADGLETLWSAALEDDDDAALLHADDEQILLLAGVERRDPHVISLDRATGERRWLTDRFDSLVTLPAVKPRGQLAQMPNGFPFDPEQTLALVAAETIFLAHRTGRVAAFDLADGRIVKWAHRTELEAVHLAAGDDHALVLAGMAASSDRRDAAAPTVLVIDPHTGELLHRVRPAGGGVVWMRIDPLAGLLMGTRLGIERVDLLTGDLCWLNQAFEIQETRRGWHGRVATIVEDQVNALRRVELREGAVSNQYERSAPGAWESMTPIQIAVEGGGAIVHHRDRILRFDGEGRVTGSDVVAEPRDYRWLLIARDRLIGVSQYDIRQAEIEGELRRRTVRTYRVYAFSSDGRVEGAPIELPPTPNRLVESRVLHGWLLLSTEEKTLVLPMRSNDPGVASE